MFVFNISKNINNECIIKSWFNEIIIKTKILKIDIKDIDKNTLVFSDDELQSIFE